MHNTLAEYLYPLVGNLQYSGNKFYTLSKHNQPKNKGIILTFLFAIALLVLSVNNAMSKETLEVGSELDYPPFAIINKNGEADGFSVDLFKAVAKVMDLEVNFRVGPWHEVRTALEKGEIDALPLVSYSEEREKVFDFSSVHTSSSATVFIRKGDRSIASEEGLKGRTIVVMQSDATHDYLIKHKFSDDLILVQTVADALRALAAGEGDLALVPRLTGLLTAKELELGNIETSGLLISAYGRGFSFAVKEGNSQLQRQLNQGLAIVKATGKYDEIYDKWFGLVDPRGVAKETVYEYVLVTGAVLLVFLAIAGLWFWSLWREIKHRKQVEVQLLKSKADAEVFHQESEHHRLFLEAVLESTEDGIVACDNNGILTYFNRATREIHGIDQEQLPPEAWAKRYDIYNPDGKSLMAKEDIPLFRAFEEKEVKNQEIIIAPKDSSWRYLEVTGQAMFDSDGNKQGAMVSMHNVTEHREAIEQLKESEGRFRSIAENMPEVFWLGSLEDPNNFQILYVNPAFEVVWQRKPEEVYQDPSIWNANIHPEDSARVQASFDLFRQGQRPFNEDFRIIPPDGVEKQIRITGSLIRGPTNKITHAAGIARDITGLKRIERALRQSQKMDAVGQLTGGIAHDFNNILNIILGNVELLGLKISHKGELYKHIEAIELSAQRAADLTKKLLGFSRNEPENIAVTDVNLLLANIENLIIRSVTPQVETERHLADNLWLTEIDVQDLENALLNLIVNARDAMHGSGKLTFETRNCILDKAYCSKNLGFMPGEYVLIVVSDTGEGVASKDQERIFEPFFTTKSFGHGTGLGLAQVFGFVKRSKGYIKVYSEESVGTSFQIYLPRTIGEGKENGIAVKKAEQLPSGTETLLIVDDEEAILELAHESLQSLGYRIITSTGAKQALELLDNEPTISLLFSDVVMPGGMNGYELANEVTAKRPAIKVLLTSGFTERTIAKNGLARFNAHLLNKPYSQFELAHQIRELLDETKNTTVDN